MCSYFYPEKFGSAEEIKVFLGFLKYNFPGPLRNLLRHTKSMAGTFCVQVNQHKKQYGNIDFIQKFNLAFTSKLLSNA